METKNLTGVSSDRLEQTIQSGAATIGRIRTLQMEALAELDQRQVPLADGSRILAEWAAARFDLAPETAQKIPAPPAGSKTNLIWPGIWPRVG